MTGLPEGWELAVERLENGVVSFTLYGPHASDASFRERLDGSPVELRGNIYRSGGAWIEHENLDAIYECCGGYQNGESVHKPEALTARAVFYAALAEEAAWVAANTSKVVQVKLGERAVYAYECDQPAAVGDTVKMWTTTARTGAGRYVEREVVGLGAGGYEGKLKSVKFCRAGERPGVAVGSCGSDPNGGA